MRRRKVLACVLSWGCAVADDPEAGTSSGAVDGATSSAPAPDDGDSTRADGGDPPSDDADDDGEASTDAATESSDGSTATTSTTSTTTTGDDLPDQLPPVDGATLRSWLEEGRYLAWDAESAIHPSDGPHGGDVRTYVNAALLESLAAAAPSHPIEAAVVKELYDVPNVVGWAVMVKVADGTGGDTWYWYEIVGASTYADGTDVELCWGCHEDGADQVLTPFPLQ